MHSIAGLSATVGSSIEVIPMHLSCAWTAPQAHLLLLFSEIPCANVAFHSESEPLAIWGVVGSDRSASIAIHCR